MFDGDAYIRALDPPAIKLGGRVYTGRALSINEWAPLEPAIREIQGGEANLRDTYEVIERFCRIAFQRPWWHFQWLLVWRRPVYALVMDLPPAALMEAVKDFFQSQARAMGAALPERDNPEKVIPEDSQPAI